ncbi:hypothetical protein CAI16_05175 [Virgibacillus dokdonensis]|uniref:DUF1440 domain-containing protein n=1 Tax=Virgibacillus dokdonensis TaxID=302167 RepID=A0A3E0WTM1_9BACI|nr:hypothetical protein [Virgibacillus dokdonensis]RFA36188.1 hypothetical protein CAI16_05175 [Virgibacillus dokdonensis]
MRQIKLIWSGCISGVVLGVFLKLTEQMTSKRVYTLLLNVDYIPILKDLPLNEFGEFMLHMIVSVILVPVIYVALTQIGHQQNLFAYMLLSSFIGAVIYVTTSFSERTPDLLDGTSFLLWVIGHVVFGWVTGFLITKIVKD